MNVPRIAVRSFIFMLPYHVLWQGTTRTFNMPRTTKPTKPPVAVKKKNTAKGTTTPSTRTGTSAAKRPGVSPRKKSSSPAGSATTAAGRPSPSTQSSSGALSKSQARRKAIQEPRNTDTASTPAEKVNILDRLYKVWLKNDMPLSELLLNVTHKVMGDGAFMREMEEFYSRVKEGKTKG